MSLSSGINQVMQNASLAFQQYKNVSASSRAQFLRTISAQIDLLGDALVHQAIEESNLPEARLNNERGRTTNQLNAFASLLEAGDWIQASIDTGDAQRKPAPKPDLRKMLFPVGPIVVFGASNFPLAFSTAGGDTASALAAGCSVVLKGHPGHPRTSALVAQAIQEAARICAMPENVFQHVDDTSIEAGQQLVQHSLTKAASFTGSYHAGKALFDLASQRQEPIPFFAEMGSVNPVVLLPEIVKQNKELPQILASSITLGVGQFCTNPGLLLVIEGEGLSPFLTTLAEKMQSTAPARMLHKGIAKNYHRLKEQSINQNGVEVLVDVAVADDEMGAPALTLVTAKDFIKSETLSEEVFGPYSLVVKCKDGSELLNVINHLRGQLSATVFGVQHELSQYSSCMDALHQKCGRLIFNGVPTGVEVCKSMQHGGPFPSTTDSRFTSVGVDAIYRFVRPVSYQDFPNELLPEELRNQNTKNILRYINGAWTRNHI